MAINLDLGRHGNGVNFVNDFGGSPNLADNASKLNAFGDYARVESAAGRRVVLTVPPGLYNYNTQNCLTSLLGIHDLHIVGYGAVFQNTNPNYGPFPGAAVALIDNNFVAKAWKINTTTINDTTFTLKTVSDHSNIAVGDWVMLGSLDIQYNGYPPNIHFFEFLQITAKDAGTGTFTVHTPIKYNHRDDFPDDTIGLGALACGTARVWHLSPRGYTWDINHVYEGIEIRLSIGEDLEYVGITGRKLTYINCVLPGISPSICGTAHFIGGKHTSVNEPDKIVGTIILDGVEVMCQTDLQSSSIDNIILRNCVFHKRLGGGAKFLSIDGCTIGDFGVGVSKGAGNSVEVRNSTISNISYPWPTIDTPAITLDGTDHFFSNGRISILKPAANYVLIPGQTINLCATVTGPANTFSGDIGSGYITKVYEDATHVHYDTTLPYTSLPAWANGSVRFARVARESYHNISGCDNARRLSAASAKGKRHWEYFEETFCGVTSFNGYWSGRTGVLTRIYFNVVQISPSANTRLILTYGQSLLKTDLSDAQSYVITLDATVAGIRDFTTAALTGKTTNDTVTLGGSGQTTLVANRWFTGGTFSWTWQNLIPSNFQAYQLPVIVMVQEFDTGDIFRSLITSLKDTVSGTLCGVVGSLP